MTELRKSGIDVLGEIPWGSHFCNFYETKQDLLDTLVPYFKAGLENKEFCLWVVSNFELVTVEDAKGALRQAVPDLDRHLSDGDIEILNGLTWYLEEDEFNLERVTGAWDAKLRHALALGYEGIRVSGDTFWLEETGWKDFYTYEKKLNDFITDLPMTVLCTYPLVKSKAFDILDVVHAHQFAIARRQGKWEVIETPQLIQAKAEIKRLNEELEQIVVERTRQLANTIAELKYEIAERKKAEVLIIREKELSNEIIDSIPGLFVLIDEDLKFIRWNKHFEMISGYAAEEILLLHAVNDFYDEDDKKKKWEILQQIYTKGISTYELGIRMKDRRKISFYFNSRLINYEGRPCIICTGIDISKRKESEDELGLAYQRLSYHVENTPLAVIELDKDLFIKRWSKRAEEIFGWKASEALGKNVYDPDFPIIYNEDIQAVNKINEQLMKGIVNRNLSPNRNYTKEGKIIYSEWYNSVLKDEHGNVITILSLVHNVTERKKAEEELQQLNEELHSLSSHLQNIREEERIQIARDIHDDLGQQLTGLKMDVNWLNKKIGTEDEIVKQKINSMIELINESLKSVRRISSDLRPSLLDNFGLIAALEWHSEDMAKRSEIKVNFSADMPDLNIPVAIATGIFRIYQELLTNAVRHANAHVITSSLQLKDDHLILKIKDDGQGMDPVITGTKKTLGLIGIKERTFALGGKYNLKSEPGKGTEVQISIPFENNIN